jgi:hypothetical protein
MDISTPTVSPLRQRMLDDMRMRKMAEHTQDGYIRAVRKLAAFLGRSPQTATIEELRRFQLHLVDAGTGPVTINATITGLKFFFDITLGRPELLAKSKRSANPSFPGALKLRTSCLGNQRTGRDEHGSTTCAAMHGAGGGLSRLRHEGQGLGRSQRRASGNAGQLVCALPAVAGQA